MKTKSLKGLWAIAAIAGLLETSSCKKENGLLNETTENPEHFEQSHNALIRMNHDWLQFTDIKAFESIISDLEKLESEEALERWSSKFKGFNSWRSNEAKEIYDNPAGEPILDIPDPLLTTLINREGRIQIADTIYQIQIQNSKPLLISVPNKFETELINGNDPAKITAAKAHPLGLLLLPFPRWQDQDDIIIPHPISDICDFPSSNLFPWWGQKGGSVYNADNGSELIKDNGRNVRIDYHRWRVGFVFYSSIGVRVKLWKHTRLGGWMSNIKMNNANIQTCSNGMVIIPGGIPSSYNVQASASASNTNSLDRNIKWAVAPMHVEVLPHHFNFKFSVNYRGQQINRFIQE